MRCFVFSLCFILLSDGIAYSQLALQNKGKDSEVIMMIESDRDSSEMDDTTNLDELEKRFVTQPMKSATIKKRKIESAKAVLKQIWLVAREYYDEIGSYPPISWDIFDNLDIWRSLGIPIDRPAGRSRFQYDIIIGGMDGFSAVARPIGKNGTFPPSDREMLDNSLLDVVDIKIDQNGVITGGQW